MLVLVCLLRRNGRRRLLKGMKESQIMEVCSGGSMEEMKKLCLTDMLLLVQSELLCRKACTTQSEMVFRNVTPGSGEICFLIVFKLKLNAKYSH
jgi:hypothetical protein